MIGKNIILVALLLLSTALQASDPITCTTDRGAVILAQKTKKASIFINSIWENALTVSEKANIPMSIILAQAIYESGCGTSRRCREDCNCFGLKSEEYLVYEKMENCFDHYRRTIMQPRYGSPQNAQEWFLALEKCWGAENAAGYVAELKKIIHSYKLYLADGKV